MRNDIGVVNHSQGFDHIWIPFRKLGVSHSGLPEGKQGVDIAEDLFQVGNRKSSDGTSEAVPSDIDRRISVKSSKSLNYRADFVFGESPSCVESIMDFAVGAFGIVDLIG